MKQQKKNLQLRKGIYYSLINCLTGMAISMPSTNKYSKDKLQFQRVDPKNNNQIWMVQQVSPQKFQIVHCMSAFVLQGIQNSHSVKLDVGKQKANQLFCIQPWNEGIKMRQPTNISSFGPKRLEQKEDIEQKMVLRKQKQPKREKSNINNTNNYINHSNSFKPNERFVARVRIKEKFESRKYLFVEERLRTVKSSFSSPNKVNNQADKKGKQDESKKVFVLKFMEVDLENYLDNTLWELRQILIEENQILLRSCIISSYRSGDVLDVPEATDKIGVQIIQYPCNFRFNQRWILIKVDQKNGFNYYQIKNVKSGLYLDIKGESTKEGAPIIQWEKNQGKNQIWRLEQQGKRTYLLRSALEKQLLLGVQQNSVKECAQIVTSKLQTQCFWLIYGHIPI